MKQLSLLLCGLLASTVVMAGDHCHVDLRHSLRVSSESLQVSSDDSLLFEIRQGGYLTVDGRSVDLSSGQRQLAENYAGDVAALIAQWVELVSSTLEFAGGTLEITLGEAFGKDSPAAVKTTRTIALAQARFEHIAKVEEGVYQISPREFNELADSMGEEIEDAVLDSMGAVFSEIGEAISSDEGSLASRLQAFGARMDSMGRQMGHMAKNLEDTANTLCDEMKALEKMERTVAKEIPELKPYPLFD